MFTLRRYSNTGVEINQEVGNGYTLIHRTFNPEDFASSFQQHFKRPLDQEAKPDSDDARIYAFVVNGHFVQALWKNQTAYIMSETGSTFANVSFM